MMDRAEARLIRALSRSAEATSDYDLNPSFKPDGRELRLAAVLVAITATSEGAGLLLTKRASHLKNHAGQIALPGGKVDAGDPSAEAAALREAQEEIGLPAASVEILGALPTHETVTGFLVTPVVGIVRRPFVPTPEAGEVEEVFTVPIGHLFEASNYAVEQRQWMGKWRRYYAVPYGPYYIWGATARILRGLAGGSEP